MSVIKRFAVALAFVLSILSCQKEPRPRFNLESKEITISSTDKLTFINFSCENLSTDSFNILCDYDWCSVTFDESELQIATTENKESIARVAKIFLFHDILDPIEIVVTQLPPEFNGKATFEIVKVTGQYSDIRYYTNTGIFPYDPGVISSAEYAKMGDNLKAWQEYIDKKADEAILNSNGAIKDKADYLFKRCPQGEFFYRCDGLSPDSAFRPIAIYLDANFVVKGVSVGDEFRTPTPVSTPSMSIEIDKVFRGDDLALLYPGKFAGTEGWAIVPVKITAENSAYWYVGYGASINISPYTGSDSLIDLLVYDLNPGLKYLVGVDHKVFPSTPAVSYIAINWNAEYLLLANAYDNEAKAASTGWKVIKLYFTESQASNASEFSFYN